MSLIVEDGTGKANAESYLSVADADTYHTNRQNTSWTGASDVKEAALRRATDYMLQMYRPRWLGYRVTDTQALDWPRAWVPLPDSNLVVQQYVASTIVPVEVKNACAELALAALSGALAPALDRAQSSVKVGPIEISYDPASPEYKRYRNVEMLLGIYMKASGVMTRLERV